jgi:iron complex transport system ATP-binding protein
MTTASTSFTRRRYRTGTKSPAPTGHDRRVQGDAVRVRGGGLVEGGTVVLRGIEWTVATGERWVVLGANGSGKTSLLRLVSFQRAPSTGTVTVLGDTYGAVDVRVARRRIGLASTALLQRLRPTLTALEVVVTGRDAALEPWWSTYSADDRERAAALLGFVGCAAHGDQQIATLSEGERKRLLVARLMMADPELLLFDEPCAGLDLGGREALVALLGELAERGGRPMVMVTHHLEEIPVGFTHVLMLRAGEIVASGRLESALTSEAVSATFDLDVGVHAEDGRYAARVRRPPRS